MADWVYIAGNRDEDQYKIGQSLDPEERVKWLNTDSPFPLGLIYAVKVSDAPACESALKARFNGSRIHREWFRLSPSQVAAVIDYMESERLKNTNHISHLPPPKVTHRARNAALSVAAAVLGAMGGGRIRKWLENRQWQRQ